MESTQHSGKIDQLFDNDECAFFKNNNKSFWQNCFFQNYIIRIFIYIRHNNARLNFEFCSDTTISKKK